jgi:hypothetical protein
MKLALVALALLLAAPAAGATAPATVRVWSTPSSNRYTDTGPKGPSAGDSLKQTTQLVNAVRQLGKAAGAVVGFDQSTVRLTSATSAVVDLVAHFPGGTLHARGTIRIDRSPNTIEVVSGTGVFLGAKGTATEIDYPNASRALNVYKLTYGTVT